ncbi:hypothetical protein Tco_0749480 [Tanacetum coccineum]|uniref:Gag-Pol polyprotein n=1 Tax=Tanacetum coccineum TaxID=301880 RepID=A0ABQ4YYI2_9ASTR
MSNTNTNLQTQTINALYNAIMEAGGKDRPPMLAPDNDIYSIVDAGPNACEIWKTIERLKQGDSINVQDLETNLYWEFGKFTSWDGESLESYYSRFYKMMNELVRNQCDVTNHQVNVQFLLQLQPEWPRFMTLVKQSQELKTFSYHKLYDILKQHQNKVNKIRAERLARTANPLALVAQQQPVYHPQNHHTYYTNNSSTRLQQAATRNRGKAIVNSLPPTYDQEPTMVAEDDEMSKDKEIDKVMALFSLSLHWMLILVDTESIRTDSTVARYSSRSGNETDAMMPYNRPIYDEKPSAENSIFGQDVDTFTRTMLLNVDQLQKQLDKDEFQEDDSIDSLLGGKQPNTSTKDSRKKVKSNNMQTKRVGLIRVKHDSNLVDTESIRTDSTVQDDSSSQENTDADDANIRPI